MSKFYSNNNLALLTMIREKNKSYLKDRELTEEGVIAEFVLSKEERGDFQSERGTASSGIKTLVCRICGNDSFVVGQAEYYTAVKCTACGYEIGIHEG
jgi:ribosomal protein L37E